MKTKLKPEDADLIEGGLKVLSPVWTASILLQLSRGKKRTKQLIEALPGLSAKTLTERLRALQRQGLLNRMSFREVPPRVEYSLTAEGTEVVSLLESVMRVSARLSEGERDKWGSRKRKGQIVRKVN